jgi:hypothetical protein
LAVLALSLLPACSGKAKESPTKASAPIVTSPATTDAGPTPCETFLRRTGELSGFEATGPGDLAYCESLTAEQVACGSAASSADELSLCIHFPDPERRAVGIELANSVRADWPGTTTIVELTVQRTLGCAFAGLMGSAKLPLSETSVLAAFGLRDARAGDPADVLAWLDRDSPNDTWRCTRTDPPNLCPRLITDCSAAARPAK